jgi:hypothetical protein
MENVSGALHRNKNKITMRKIIIILSVLAVIMSSCGQNSTEKQSAMENNTQFIQDTVVVKQRKVLNNPTLGVLYSKSYSYYWLAEKDTLDFTLNVTEYEKDSTFNLRVFHKEPILFAIALEKIEECFSLIEEDFNLSKLTSFNFMPPIFYLDLATKLSSDYEQEFGRKNINYTKLNKFLLESSLTSQLNHFLNPLNKKVKRYGLEKFFLIEKKYYEYYLSNVDFTEYPEFTFNAHTGISVSLENK